MNTGIVSSRLLLKLPTLSGFEVLLGFCPVELSLLCLYLLQECVVLSLSSCIKYSFFWGRILLFEYLPRVVLRDSVSSRIVSILVLRKELGGAPTVQ